MDDNDPSRRRYVQNPYTSQPQSQSNAPASSSYASSPMDRRFRQPSYITHSASSVAPTTGRASSDQVYVFAQGPQYETGASAPAQALQYTSDLHTPDMSRQHDAPQYGQYGSNVLYGLAQQTQPETQSPYDPVSRYAHRPGTASTTLVPPFGSPYYLAGQPAPSSATLPDLAPPHLPSQYQATYTQAGPSSQTYASAMMDPTQSSSSSSNAPRYAQRGSQSADQRFSNYKAQIRTIFSHVRDGSLQDVGGMLVDASRYLLSNVEALGLTRDDDFLHEERVNMWDEFNRAWLTTLQAQFDMAQEYSRTRQLRESTSYMNQQTLETLSRELVRLCDGIEKHGLVDYQMGVAEEEIIDLLMRCLEQLDRESMSNADPGAESSSSAPQ